MRRALLLSALLGLLTGCAGNQDPSGTWINQAAIDAASKSGKLREALLAYGPNLEWRLDSKNHQASYSNGFEQGEGQLSQDPSNKKRWQVAFYGSKQEELAVDGKQLLQVGSDNWPEQRFARPADPTQAPIGASFQRALYGSFLKGTWVIKEGQGEGAKVTFQADGRVEGMPAADRYALCLAGDCAAMSGNNDSIWLQQGRQGREYLFQREDDKLELFEAVNRAQADEMPEYAPGQRVWLLERD